MLKTIVKAMTPPIIQTQVKSLLFKKNGYFSGPYSSWGASQAKSSSYQEHSILEKVKDATMQTKQNPKLYVRDGIVFDTPQYSYPLLACLLNIAIENGGKLNVLDFGGGLGTTYYSLRNFCPHIQLNWSIVEQNHFVECGRANFETNSLHFYNNIDEISIHPEIILLSGTLQYLEDPFEWLQRFSKLEVSYLILDRTWFDTVKLVDEILVEHVPEHIYKASYPCWKFSYSKMIEKLTKKYHVLCEFDAIEGRFKSHKFKIASKGFLLRKIAN